MTKDATVDIEMGRAAAVMTCAVTWGAHSKSQFRGVPPDFIFSSVENLRQSLFECLASVSGYAPAAGLFIFFKALAAHIERPVLDTLLQSANFGSKAAKGESC